MTVVQADGLNVVPTEIDEFQIAVAETYDVIVTPVEDRAYTLVAEANDRSGMGRATLAPRVGMIDRADFLDRFGGVFEHSPFVAERALDAANRKAGQAELIKQARGDTPMRLAENAARTAIEQSFAMPLKAAGIDAKVTARFGR